MLICLADTLGCAGRVYGRDTHVAVNAVNDVLRGQVWNLRVCLHEDGRELVDEVFPLSLRQAVDRLCRQTCIRDQDTGGARAQSGAPCSLNLVSEMGSEWE